MSKISIAIDGPSGAGKSTLAKSLAARLGYLYVDTGAIYRTIGYYAFSHGIDPKDENGVVASLPEIRVEMTYGDDGLQHMLLNGADVTKEIRLPEISMYASAVSAHPGVRAFLLEMQRQLAHTSNVIMDGRDIGTVVLPDAKVKVYLTASSEERARRRWLEMNQKGAPDTYEQVLADLKKRDDQDMNRQVDPLRPTPDATIVDSTEMNFEQVVEYILAIVKEKTA